MRRKWVPGRKNKATGGPDAGRSGYVLVVVVASCPEDTPSFKITILGSQLVARHPEDPGAFKQSQPRAVLTSPHCNIRCKTEREASHPSED